MKKIITLLALFVLLVGCSSNKGLMDISSNDKTKDIDNNMPKFVNVYDEETNISYSFSDEETIKEIVDLFKKVTVLKEKEVEFANAFSLTFEYEDGDYEGFYFYDNTIEVYKDDGSIVYYELSGLDELLTYIKDKLQETYVDDGGSKVIYDENGLTISQESCYVENDNYILSIYGNNQTEKDVYLKVDATVNGFDIHSYQTLGIFAENGMGFDITIPTDMLKEYGINDVGVINYVVNIYEADIENHNIGDLIDKSDICEISISDSVDTDINKGDCLFDENNISVYAKLKDGSFNTNAYLYIENTNDVDAVISINSVNYNGTSQAYDADDSFVVNLKANSNKFVLIPIYNYEYDENTQSTSIVDIESLNIDTSIVINDVTAENNIVIK